MKNKLILLLLLISVVLTGCDSRSDNIDGDIMAGSYKPVRLAEDYNGDWGIEAIGLRVYEKRDGIKIAVLDSGTNSEAPQITESYSLISEDGRDSLNHGTIIIDKLIQLVPYAEIMSIKVFDDNDYINQSVLKDGIDLAVEKHVDIINISLGSNEYSDDVMQSILKAVEHNIVIISAGGNQGEDTLLYPAAYDGVISVISRDINNRDSRLNNYSTVKKSFSAPGEHILVSDGEYITGSSVACVFMCATVANIKNCNKNISLDEITDVLVKTSVYPTEYSYGIIQCDDAIDCVS